MEKEKVPLKRKRVVLSLEEKLDVIKLRENGVSFNDISQHYNIGFTTIKDIIKRRKKIEEVVEKEKSLGKMTRKKILCDSRRPAVEGRLYDHICAKLDNNEVVTNTEILQKAKQYCWEVHQENWAPSKGWLSKFKNRYNLSSVKTKHGNFVKNEESESNHEDNESPNCEEETDAKNEHDEEMYAIEELETTSDDTNRAFDAAVYLVDFVEQNSSNFNLKDIISLQIIRDKIVEMHGNAIDL